MKRKLDLNYGELAKDEAIVYKCEDLKKGLIEIREILDQLLPLKAHYDKLTLPVQIELDLFLVYALNSLFWINLRLEGVDTRTHPIIEEIGRIKTAIAKWKEIKERNDRPKLDMDAAKRFIKSGLYDPYKESAKRINNKIIFNDDDN